MCSSSFHKLYNKSPVSSLNDARMRQLPSQELQIQHLKSFYPLVTTVICATTSEGTKLFLLVATPLTSNIIDLLLGEIRQAGILVALGPAVVVNSGSHFRWIVP